MLDIRVSECIEERRDIEPVPRSVVFDDEPFERPPVNRHIAVPQAKSTMNELDEDLTWGAVRLGGLTIA